MLPKRAKRTAEENEDEMASRLHLDIGKRQNPLKRLRRARPTRSTERVRLSHDRANESNKTRAVDNFRSVTFENWLRLFMQVRSPPYAYECRDLTDFAVRFHSNKAWKV
jgi:hypothetical protein